MRDFLSYVWHNARILARHDSWFVLIAVLILLITAGWTVAVQNPPDWSPATSILQAEVLGSLLTALLSVGLLDPELRHGAAEIVFSKPLSPALLLGVRFTLMLVLNFALLTGLLLIYRFTFHDTALWQALGYALPTCLFVGMMAVTAARCTRSTAAGIALPLIFWLWDTTAGVIYNPLFLLPAGSFWGETARSVNHIGLIANKTTLLILALALFQFNVRRLRGSGATGPPRMRTGVGRLHIPALVFGLLFAYFWSGGIAMLCLIRLTPASALQQTHPGLAGPMRPGRGEPLVGLNGDLRSHMSVYGPAPFPQLLGPGLAACLRGLGLGLNQTEDDYDTQRMASLRESVKAGGPWANYSRLELAAMESQPTSYDYSNYIMLTHASEQGAAWITVGLADPARWWVTRKSSGSDPDEADRLCAEVLASHPSAALAVEALRMRADLAAHRWNFALAEELRLRLAQDFPDSTLTPEALQGLPERLIAAGRSDEALTLVRRVLDHQPAAQRIWLAMELAGLQAQKGDIETARRTLQRGLGDVDTAEQEGMQRREGNASREMLKEALQRMASGAPQPARQPTLSVPLRRVHTRLLAQGRPLPGVRVALLPRDLVIQALPARMGVGWDRERPVGQFPAGASRSNGSYDAPDAYNGDWLRMKLREHPEFVAASDAEGRLEWHGIPVGAVVVMLHLGSWQLHGEAERLAPVPPTETVAVQAEDAALPDLRLEPTIHVTTTEAAGVPAAHWNPIEGAVRYRVGLRIDAAGQTPPTLAPELGGASLELEPNLVWWRDQITGTTAALTPEQFVGPADDRRTNGLTAGVPYVWMVIATDRSGRVLATSESLLTPPILQGVEWSALRSIAGAGGTRGKEPRNSGLIVWSAPGPEMSGPSASFSSPFLSQLLTPQAAHAASLPPRRPAPKRDLPQQTAPGQGLPPRPALRTPGS